jgi:hypothetical protein
MKLAISGERYYFSPQHSQKQTRSGNQLFCMTQGIGNIDYNKLNKTEVWKPECTSQAMYGR